MVFFVINLKTSAAAYQGLRNQLITPTIASLSGGPVRCRERLGGILKFYHREAA